MLLLIPSITFHSVNAMCMSNSDWPSAPCYGCAMCTPSIEKQREDWASYYQYKGAVWMEMMKTKMESAIKNDTLQDWVSYNQSNYDVWRYYYLNNQAPLFGNSSPVPEFPFALPMLLVGITSLIVLYKIRFKDSIQTT